VREVRDFCDRHGLWLIEDNCDALGSRYDGQLTGHLRRPGQFQFLPGPPHHHGEGGAVVTANEDLARIARSLRDWGRDCYCTGGETIRAANASRSNSARCRSATTTSTFTVTSATT